MLGGQSFAFRGKNYKVHSYNTVVVGSGAAGFSAADRLYRYGQTSVVLITENIYAGTSRNTGSDKQTYYKLSLSGSTLDSVEKMAESYFGGQCVDGDTALCEAALSIQCFMNLVELGVPFPHNQYGEYVGYKTDHDPMERATSAGPYTSKIMTECLQKKVENSGIRIIDKMQAIRILTKDDRVRGLLCFNIETNEFEFFACVNVILATGAAAGMYAQSVYPIGQIGSTGMAFEAGAVGRNLTEWQFGMASLLPRWNVSGTYMQALPRFLSIGQDGEEPQEFLKGYFKTKEDMLYNIFLKGYQWPFDVKKATGGSSLIDLLVYNESQKKGKRIFLDFRKNAGEEEIRFDKLPKEAFAYLYRANACSGTPVDRLKHMNQPAFDFFLEKGIDLSKDLLEISVCVQHNNGGLAVDSWWQTNIKGLFAIGEVSGTHGVYRPGGSALNAGQVGALRCAQYISGKGNLLPAPVEDLFVLCKDQISEILSMADAAIKTNKYNVMEEWKRAADRMSRVGAVVRNGREIGLACQEVKDELDTYVENLGIANKSKLGDWFRLRETLICQLVYLGAMKNYIDRGGKSRGGSLYTDSNGDLPNRKLPEQFRFSLDNGEYKNYIQEASYFNGKTEYTWRQVRQIPLVDNFFENVWREFRKHIPSRR